jgi:hypothetical protein
VTAVTRRKINAKDGVSVVETTVTAVTWYPLQSFCHRCHRITARKKQSSLEFQKTRGCQKAVRGGKNDNGDNGDAVTTGLPPNSAWMSPAPHWPITTLKTEAPMRDFSEHYMIVIVPCNTRQAVLHTFSQYRRYC